jgi:hypothetical protein
MPDDRIDQLFILINNIMDTQKQLIAKVDSNTYEINVNIPEAFYHIQKDIIEQLDNKADKNHKHKELNKQKEQLSFVKKEEDLFIKNEKDELDVSDFLLNNKEKIIKYVELSYNDKNNELISDNEIVLKSNFLLKEIKDIKYCLSKYAINTTVFLSNNKFNYDKQIILNALINHKG